MNLFPGQKNFPGFLPLKSQSFHDSRIQPQDMYPSDPVSASVSAEHSPPLSFPPDKLSVAGKNHLIHFEGHDTKDQKYDRLRFFLPVSRYFYLQELPDPKAAVQIFDSPGLHLRMLLSEDSSQELYTYLYFFWKYLLRDQRKSDTGLYHPPRHCKKTQDNRHCRIDQGLLRLPASV